MTTLTVSTTRQLATDPYATVNVTADDATVLVRWVEATHGLAVRRDYLGFRTRTTLPTWVRPIPDLTTAQVKLASAIDRFEGP